MYPVSRLDAALPLRAHHASHSWWPRRSIVLACSAVILASALVAAGNTWQHRGTASTAAFSDIARAGTVALSWVGVVLQLAAAALIGMLVTAVQREVQRDRTLSRSMEQAQTLLCVSGALMMIIIGDSLARAFGIAGAAAIIRFRTPVEDPRDTTILFLLLALGMAAGIGALPVAGIGTLALCALLPALDRFSGATPRLATLDCTASTPEFPVEEMERVFARYGIAVEPREVTHGETSRMKYLVALGPAVELEDLTRALVADARLASLAWDIRKKG